MSVRVHEKERKREREEERARTGESGASEIARMNEKLDELKGGRVCARKGEAARRETARAREREREERAARARLAALYSSSFFSFLS